MDQHNETRVTMSNGRPLTKRELANVVASRTGATSRDVNDVLDALGEVVLEQLSPDGPGSVTIAGLVKVEVSPQAARAEGLGRNPGTGEAITIAARPARARGKVRLRALKRLRDVL